MDFSARDTSINVNLQVFRDNISKILKFVGPGRGILAVVKANAYGHGMAECAKAAVEAGASILGVGFTSQALALRNQGITAPILVMVTETTTHIPYLVDNDIIIGINSYKTLAEIEKYTGSSGKRCKVHIKVDTGMGRNGLDVESAFELTRKAWQVKGLDVDGIYSHFPSADEEDDAISYVQIKIFSRLLERLEKIGKRPKTAHLCNSAGTLKYPEAHFDMIRPGLLTYGVPPFPGSEKILETEPVMSWTSRVTVLREVPSGYPVSYGCTFFTDRRSVLATVPVGYGDGFRWSLSNRGSALINGIKVPIVGRVCMDQTVFDVTDAGNVEVGSPVTLIGRQGNEILTAEDMAGKAGTISYEILTGITSRVPRTYI